MSHIEILDAWYGTEASHSDRGGLVAQTLRESVAQHGRLRIPADMTTFFGFDPCPRAIKIVAIHVRCNGREKHLRGHEGHDLDFAPPPYITVIDAWFGTEEQHGDPQGTVLIKLRESVQHHGRITVPGEMTEFFGFDPCPNAAKVLAIYVRLANGSEQHLRAIDGQAFDWRGC